MMHKEKHITSSETIRDIVIGMSDGLAVPFALAAGLFKVVFTGALAAGAAFVIARLINGF